MQSIRENTENLQRKNSEMDFFIWLEKKLSNDFAKKMGELFSKSSSKSNVKDGTD